MRTTIRLDDQLLVAVKKLAAEKGTTMTAIIDDALRQALARRKASKRRSRVRLTTFGGRGLQPGVDLDDTASLIDRMESLGASD
jgi:hypothetical protein